MKFSVVVPERNTGQGEYQDSSDSGFRLQEGTDLADCRACGKDVVHEQNILSLKMLGSLEAKRSP